MELSKSDRSRSFSVRMLRFAICNILAAITVVVMLFSRVLAAPSAPPSDYLVRKPPTWRLPEVAEVKTRANEWIRQNSKDAAQTKALAIVAVIGEKADGMEMLNRLGEAFAAADPQAAQLVDFCSRPRSHAALPGFTWLTDTKTAPFLTANLRLYFGRWLVQGGRFEEALDQIGSLKPADVVAPAELLFYQGVAYHRLLNKEQGMKVLDQLLEGSEFSPRRYVTLALLMQSDLETLEEGTLEHIARQMEGVGRSLDKGRAGPKVLKAEDRIIEALDKLIKGIEGNPGCPGGPPGLPGHGSRHEGPGNSLWSNRPAENSAPRAGKGPGKIDKRDIGRKSGWGNLPPKQREEALQQMGRDFPPHYRDAIEQYFRKLATEDSDDDDK